MNNAIQDQVQSLKDLASYYNNTDSRYIYFDKTFDIRGIDYTKFIQLKFESINNNYIKDKYTIDGWYILWYLMSRSTKSEYIVTTVNSISEETNLKATKIKETLKILSQQEIIISNKSLSKISNTELLQIYIGYNNNLCSHISQNGYIPIPSEFVYYIIPTLTPTEWSIYTVLLTKYNYFLAWEDLDRLTGELTQFYQRTHYAYPTQNLMGEYIGVTDETVSKFINKLIKSKYNLISTSQADRYSYFDRIENKQIWKGGNFRYHIKLFERPEYVYYYLNNKLTKQEQNEFNYIRDKGFDQIALSHEQNKIKNKRNYYIKYYFKETLKMYMDCLQTQDKEVYKTIRETHHIIV